MTECERIIKDGILPESFFREEVRNDFLVDVKRKKIWAIELDLLLQLDKVCKQNGIRYFLAYGTLIGAVRHGGFVPWDDDLDIHMLRGDFECFMRCADQFAHPYFLQTPHNSPGYAHSFPRLRNSNTCYFNEYRSFWGFNSGIFIDIQPIDKLDVSRVDDLYAQVKDLNEYNSAFMKMVGNKLDDAGRKKLRQHYGLLPSQAYDKIHQIASRDHNVVTDFVANNISTMVPWKKHTFRADAFSSALDFQFEGYEFPVPVGYDHVLHVRYGDYMKMPSAEQRLSGHDNSIFEPDVPYDVFMRNRGVDIWGI